MADPLMNIIKVSQQMKNYHRHIVLITDGQVEYVE
jgi:hypothetical protein